ncbi:globin domain-containing protein [Actinoallomurus purpureus]|uniref:globin domain-containing protein n=1 Tax=Actinoallomurus purpureus TaxID=478114 RepID=UPI002093C0E4|nr:globin domain-containing protein [Actinoallomurus purpureus]MCO6006090.1 globin domain-containing protein [Actinoallomurus purpureus]
MSVDIALLRESWALVSESSEKVATQFYGMLFSRYPQVRALFPAGMDAQRDRLLQALTYVVLNLEDTESVAAYLGELAKDHRKFGARPEHYPAVGRCLVASMRAVAGEAWRPEYSDAWQVAYDLISTIMIQAAAKDETSSPPYWNARVIAHEHRSPETAVITVEPEQPYPFLAGQYATIQTARWPRIWRAYSIANAPRPDNRLTFHVRLIPAGWVSTTLVRQTSVGDRLMLGPPRGMMTLPSPQPERLLCLAGGTGLAPLKAIIDETLRTSHAADITLIHGARRQNDLYDVADLTRLATTQRRLRLVTAVSDDPDHPPRRTVADVIGRDHVETWPLTYVCGPPEMVLATLDRLADLGLPAHRIRSEPDAGQIMHRLRSHAPI